VRGYRVRRAPHLVCYWRDGGLIVRNYATGGLAKVSPLAVVLLDFAREWRTLDDVAEAVPLASRAALGRAVRRLVAHELLERSDRPRDARVTRMEALDPWNPEAGFFHTATRTVRFWPTAKARRVAAAKAEHTPVPRASKRYSGVPAVPLPIPLDGDWKAVLQGRRTWRRYASTPVSRDDLGTVLGLAAGIQFWAKGLGGRVPLKTSPSGGARHPIEAYVLVQRVAGVAPGIYHYSAERHELERLRGPVPRARIRRYLPHSGYFAAAPVLVFFTAMFERQLWRYPYSRAYRAALIEAGHVCQTLLLTATWLGLAPFSVMGLADAEIERDLKVDGVTEAVLYAAGFGRPPRGAATASLTRGTLELRRNSRLG
jgi:SagB-type dehydrogenase family enzyme